MMKDLPTVASEEAWPTRWTIDRAANLLDRVAKDFERMEKALKALRRNWPTAQDIEQARKAARQYEKNTRQEVVSGAALKQLNDCEPASWRYENYNVRKSELSKMLALLVSSFPTSNVQNPEVFTRFMLEDVAGLEPHFEVLDCACRELRTTKTFMPAIAEVISAIKKHDKIWSDRFHALDCVEDSYAELIETIAKCETNVEGDKGFERPSPPALPYKPSMPMPDLGPVDDPIAPAASLAATTPEPKSERVKE
jgi:hypothetical protein